MTAEIHSLATFRLAVWYLALCPKCQNKYIVSGKPTTRVPSCMECGNTETIRIKTAKG